MRVLLVGYGRMGRMVETVGAEQGVEVAGRLNTRNNAQGEAIVPGEVPLADVAIDFSTSAALVRNFSRLVTLGVPLVIGTTGWSHHEAAFRRQAAEAGIGVVAAPNFSPGVVLFEALVEHAAALFGPRDDFGAFVHDLHHAAKRDAPSGTARALISAMERAAYPRRIEVTSTRARSFPGTHLVGFDGPFETVTLTHTTRDRATFARGALEAARWIRGRHGWFTMREVLGLAVPMTEGQ